MPKAVGCVHFQHLTEQIVGRQSVQNARRMRSFDRWRERRFSFGRQRLGKDRAGVVDPVDHRREEARLGRHASVAQQRDGQRQDIIVGALVLAFFVGPPLTAPLSRILAFSARRKLATATWTSARSRARGSASIARASSITLRSRVISSRADSPATISPIPSFSCASDATGFARTQDDRCDRRGNRQQDAPSMHQELHVSVIGTCRASRSAPIANPRACCGHPGLLQTLIVDGGGRAADRDSVDAAMGECANQAGKVGHGARRAASPALRTPRRTAPRRRDPRHVLRACAPDVRELARGRRRPCRPRRPDRARGRGKTRTSCNQYRSLTTGPSLRESGTDDRHTWHRRAVGTRSQASMASATRLADRVAASMPQFRLSA